MKSKIGIITFLLVAAMLLASACGGGKIPFQEISPPPSETTTGAGESPSGTPESPASPESPAAAVIDKDREGNPITLPQTIDKIISVGPSNTEVLIGLGFGDKIIAADEYSSGIEGLKTDIPLFSMMAPDGEQIISLDPDVIFVTGMSKAYGDNPFKVVSDTGICVVYIPSSSSIDEIKEDIRFFASALGVVEKGDEMVGQMEREIEDVRKIGETITDKKNVYFEIAAAPDMYSFGKGVFLNELIELVGARNILEDQESWVSVTDEVILAANPDVILTSVYYIDDPVGEIMSRPGWNAITAVQNSDVYAVDADHSNRPSQNIVLALKELAAAIYPDKF